jgi:hypothetical protein
MLSLKSLRLLRTHCFFGDCTFVQVRDIQDIAMKYGLKCVSKRPAIAKRGFRAGVVLACVLMLGPPVAKAQATDQVASGLPELYSSMVQPGIEIVPGLPKPIQPPLLIAAQGIPDRQILLKQLAGRHSWEKFSRDSVAAPVHIEVNYLQDVVYAPLSSIQDKQLMESLFGSSREDQEQLGFEPEAIPESVLQLAGIGQVDKKLERYSTLHLPLMNRVTLRGTARIETYSDQRYSLVSWQLDPHFTFPEGATVPDTLAKFVNHSVKVQRDDLGRISQSPAVPYIGCGGYLCVQETGLADNQLLIESRLVLHEPDHWFSGSNFLRSKFPTVLQESAQSFRRKLASSK